MYIELVENNVRKKRTLTDLDLNVFDGGRTAAPTQTRKEHLNSAQHVTLWGASSHHWAKGPKYCRWTDQTIDVDVWSSTGGEEVAVGVWNHLNQPTFSALVPSWTPPVFSSDPAAREVVGLSTRSERSLQLSGPETTYMASLKGMCSIATRRVGK